MLGRTKRRRYDVVMTFSCRGGLLKGTTTKITSQEGGFLNFLGSLMTTGLPLMKSILTPLAKNVLFPLGLSQQCQQQIHLLKRKFMDQELRHK